MHVRINCTPHPGENARSGKLHPTFGWKCISGMTRTLILKGIKRLKQTNDTLIFNFSLSLISIILGSRFQRSRKSDGQRVHGAVQLSCVLYSWTVVQYLYVVVRIVWTVQYKVLCLICLIQMDEEVTQEQADRAEAAARHNAALQLRSPARDPRAVPLADKALEFQVLNLLLLAAPLKEIKKGIKESM